MGRRKFAAIVFGALVAGILLTFLLLPVCDWLSVESLARSRDWLAALVDERPLLWGSAFFALCVVATALCFVLFATADIPPEPGRNVSLGMIALARRTGRPIYAIATATSRRKILERVWDKMQLNFPFSTIAFACEGPIYMTDPAVTDEAYAADLAQRLDRVLAKAFDMADGKIGA